MDGWMDGIVEGLCAKGICQREGSWAKGRRKLQDKSETGMGMKAKMKTVLDWGFLFC